MGAGGTFEGSDGVFGRHRHAVERKRLRRLERDESVRRPANQVASLSQGDRLHVLGIPRVNVAEVAAVATLEPKTTRLPYEMIVVAILP